MRGKAVWINGVGVGAIALVVAVWIWRGSLLASPRDRIYVIPPGTAARLAEGSLVVAVPVRIGLTAGDHVVFVNDDEADHRLGGFYVVAGSTLRIPFPEPGEFWFLCSVTQPGHTVFEVAERGRMATLGWATLAMAGLLAGINGALFGGRSSRLSLSALTGGGAALVAGSALTLSSYGAFDRSRTPATNPIAPTEQSVAAGSVVYQQFCVTCHGQDGRGDGPLAPALDPQPGDLVVRVPQDPDRALFDFVQKGIPGSGMPALAISEEDTWHLLNYLRTLD